MRKFNYILNDLAFDTLVIKCLYGEPTDEDVKECENQIELLKQENQTLKDVIKEVRKKVKVLQEKYFRMCVPGSNNDCIELLQILDKGESNE